MVFVTKNKTYEQKVQNFFPEFEATHKGLVEAYSLSFPGKELPAEAYKKIKWSHDYLSNGRSDFFTPLYEHEVASDRSKFSNRGFYAKHGAFQTYSFEDYLGHIIEVIVFSQNFDTTKRKAVERYYREKGKQLRKIQNYRQSKIAELASFVMYSTEPRDDLGGEAFDDYARMSFRHCFEVLKAVFEMALDIRLDIFNNENNLKEALHKHLEYYPPNRRDMPFEVVLSENPATKLVILDKVPRPLSQKPS